MAPQLRAGCQPGRLVGENALEAEHEPVPHLPARRRRPAAGLELGERVVERPAPGSSLREHLLGVFARMEERLAGPRFGAGDVGGQISRNGLVEDELFGGFLHVRSSNGRCCLSTKVRPSEWCERLVRA